MMPAQGPPPLPSVRDDLIRQAIRVAMSGYSVNGVWAGEDAVGKPFWPPVYLSEAQQFHLRLLMSAAMVEYALYARQRA
jgi:hypothetical protein